jgi:UDP-N-acetyl-D-glucosamine dehydrogenase
LPLAAAFAKRDFKVVGIDISKERVSKIADDISYIDDISDEELKIVKREYSFSATGDFKILKQMDCIIICVPTPLNKTKQPDLSFVLAAVKQVAQYVRKDQLIVLESTTYPGTTKENILPMLEEKSGLKVGKDILLGFSPERVDPGNRRFELTDIPKIVGGIERVSTSVIKELYGSVFADVVTVSNTDAAEMVKLLENTFRSVNIGLINEMARVCYGLGIDVWEVIRAASTKPFGFMPFYPGPGIGGHCINIDSMYLAWKARLHGFEPRLIELAQQINDETPRLMVERIIGILNDHQKAASKSRILALGAAYKKNVSDVRESPSLDIIGRLSSLGARVSYHDPFVPRISVDGREFKSISLTRSFLNKQDLIIILTDHDKVDYKKVIDSRKPVFDTRNALEKFNGKKNKVIKL